MTDLSQAETDELFAMEKHQIGSETFTFPSPELGGKIAVPLVSVDGKESFILDVARGRFVLKGTMQTRARTTVILARICIGRGPHTNPDGMTFPCPHLHLYREGFGDKFAMPLPDTVDWHPNDLLRLLGQFLRYCNVTGPVMVQGGLL